ncbi:hypothetical protein Ahy_B08g089206 [Arachis hypogaea]|uniref:Uncharacterized protein n=1 Tax=Arachis hypogaea TaxID=3818 RepID=A0A444XX39_ARAHY|nr:hypothetical protein Ahy_B08g089206 [Arachis hypogaea]
MSDEQSDSAMMNPWDIGDPWDMIDFYADEAPQFQFESPPLPEPVWNGDENKIVAANVGDPQPQPCAMDVTGNQPPQPVIDEFFPEAMKRTEHYCGSPLSGYQPLQSQPQSCAIDVCGNQQPQLQSQPVIDEYFPEVMKRTEHYCGSPLSGYQPHQSQPQSCPINVCGNQPPQIPSQSQPWSRPLQSQPQPCAIGMYGNLPPQLPSQPPQLPPQPQPRSGPRSQPWSRSRPRLLSEPRPQSQTEIVRMATNEFFADTCGYPPPQPQPPVWTWEENKAFESVITSCFQDSILNHREAVAARLPGRTLVQLKERFQKLMNDISAIHNGYPTNTPLNAASDNMTIMMEHNPPSIPIINATPPPPLPPYSTAHHHREEVLPAAEEELVPTAGEEAAPTKTGYHWTQDEHRLFLRGYQEEGKHWKRISEYYVKTKTSSQISSHAQKHFLHQEESAKGKKLRKSIFDVI